ncbi:Histone acetyltransferase [Kalmusia sp. IMI 367209]|nr:Histone acetyltransferase [Kalmusia sp. IMI 367209]
MAEPGRLLGQSTSNLDPEDLDADGEYEEDDMGYGHIMQEHTQDEGHTTDAEGSDVDAEGEEVDEDDDSEPVGAVKIAPPVDVFSEDDEEDEHDRDAAVESSSDAKTSYSEDESGSSELSEVEGQWLAESEDGEELDAGRADPNVCVYCNEDEDNDPNDEFEETLSCVECGDMACIQNKLHKQDESSESLTRRRLSSVPKLARDLLPSHRGHDPGGHSIFNELILPDDTANGARSLRKRKASLEAEPLPVRQTRKRRRSSEASKSDAGGSTAASPPRAQARSVLTDGNETDGAHHTASDHESSRLRSSRARRTKPKRNDKRPLAWIDEPLGAKSLVLVFHLNNEKVQKIVTAKPKKSHFQPMTREEERQERRRERDRERRERNRRAAQAARESIEESHYPTVQPQYTAPFYGFADKEMDENKSKPYGGILSEADADTSRTYPTPVDRKRFEDARQRAEEDWKRKQEELYAGQEPQKPTKQVGPPSKIKCINFGGWEIDTWHAAPYPEEYSKNRVLYICEFCLKYMNSDYVAWRHKLKCPAKHPPGDEIYRDGKYSFFEVDGRKNPVYCQNLCLLAKLFLGSKTLYYDVEPFLFYVMTECDQYGYHFVGYFSKEKRPSSLNNVSCILVLPIHMRKGYGQYLIEFSYLLTRVEKKTGSPEKPLSDMGLVSYRKYWRLVMCEELLNHKGPISIATISESTGMTTDDIVSALEGLRALVRDPITKTYALRLDYTYMKQYIDKCYSAGNPTINPERLQWTPYVMGRLGQYEDGPALHTVQQRDEGDNGEKPEPEEGVQIEMAAKAAKTNGTWHNGSATGEDGEGAVTPTLVAEDSASVDSPTPGTPLANGSTVAIAGSQMTSAPLIPATRYEVFPHIPGQPPPKRRPGRPFGARRRTSTPQRNRSQNLTIATAPVSRIQFSPSGSGKASPTINGVHTPGTISLRRTRSRLGESVVNGVDDDELEEGGEVKAPSRRTTRSSTKSPHTSKNTKGKGKTLPDEEEDDGDDGEDEDEDVDEDEDAEGEDDEDAEGEDDEDAEGEDDEDAEGEDDEDAEGDTDLDAEGEDDDDIVMPDA